MSKHVLLHGAVTFLPPFNTKAVMDPAQFLRFRFGLRRHTKVIKADLAALLHARGWRYDNRSQATCEHFRKKLPTGEDLSLSLLQAISAERSLCLCQTGKPPR